MMTIKNVLPVALLAMIVSCASKAPTTQPTTQEVPVVPKEGLDYFMAALKDSTRRIDVTRGPGEGGELDDSGRRRLRAAMPKWWEKASIAKLDPQRPFMITPDMTITIYGKGSIALDPNKPASDDDDQSMARIRIFKIRKVARVMIDDEGNPRLGGVVFVLPTTDPETWVTRLLAGKL